MIVSWNMSGVFFRRVVFLLMAFSSLCFAEEVQKMELERESNEEIKIACLFPMTGPGAHYGKDSAAAIKIVEEELEQKLQQSFQDSKLSKPYPSIKVLIGDTKSKPLRAVQLARKFIDEGQVSFLCGCVSSSVALAVTEIAHSKEVIFVGTDHASPRLVDEALHPYYFRMNNGTRQSMRAGAKYIAEHYRSTEPLKIAFIGPDYDYGYRAWDDLRYFLKQENMDFTIVAELWPKLHQKDYSIYVDALVNVDADIVVSGHWGVDFVNIIREVKKSKLLEKASLMNFDAGGNYDTLAELGDEMPVGLVLSARHHVNWPETQGNRQFVEKFYQRTGRYPSYAASGAYAGVYAIAEVVRKAGGVSNKARLLEEFKRLRLKLPEDPDGFESVMDSESHQILQVQAIGKTIRDPRFVPAKVLLGDWFAYYPPKRWSIK